MSQRQPYLFIDRDGTIIEEPLPSRQIDSLAKLRLEPQVIPALLKLQAAGYRLVMVSNQDGLGTESFPAADFWTPHNTLMNLLQSQGLNFQASLVCPHHPEERCSCRKPALGLVQNYLQAGLVDFEKSCVIGDRESDLQLAEAMGIRGLQYAPDGLDWPSIVATLCEGDRRASVSRKTNETNIQVSVNLDGNGAKLATGNAFFDHMLEQIAAHAGIAIDLKAEGDWHVDDHHVIEDVALCIGEAIDKALGKRQGIGRYGFTLPMDESLATCAIDLSGRPVARFEGEFPREEVKGLACEMIPHFFQSMSVAMRAAIHIEVKGENAHHMVEACFKVFGRALRAALAKTTDAVPSTKGSL